MLSPDSKTPERIELEDTIEGLQEETEEEQWEHNLNMSLSRYGELEMEVPPYDESEDEKFQEAVDLYTSGRLEESKCLAKESRRHSRKNLLRGQEADDDTEVDEKPGKRPALRGRIVSPKVSVDEFTDSEGEFPSMGNSMTSLNDSQSRRTKSDHGPLSEEELNARITRQIQHAARKQQKQQEQERLRQAQEIQRKLQEVDVKQRELEERGDSVERALRGEGPKGGRLEAELMQEWFNLVHDKNAIVRLESELMASARKLELEDRQGRLQQQLRESMAFDDSLKSPLQREREQKIHSELIEIVEERDKLVAMLEEERVRERAEDKDLENVMKAKGFIGIQNTQ